MKKIILTVGCSGSGKTTWAEKVTSDARDENGNLISNINRDDIRFELFNNGVRDWTKYKFSKAKEKRVSEVVEAEVKNAVHDGNDIIISDTNLNPKTREKWKTWARENGYEYEEKLFECSWDELVKRDSQREGGVGLLVLRKQYMAYLEYIGRKTYEPNTDLHKAVIVDVDGTVAQMVGRKPFDWDRVSEDEPRKEIIAMVLGLYTAGYHIIFLSGRDGVCYDDTQKWLARNVNVPFELHMRAKDDWRKDFVAKEELFWPLTEKWNICLAIDDRPQVLRLWEELRVPTVNVNTSLYNDF